MYSHCFSTIIPNKKVKQKGPEWLYIMLSLRLNIVAILLPLALAAKPLYFDFSLPI